MSLILSCASAYASQTNDLAQHPADITLDWVECVGFLCDDDAAVSQPVVTCVEGKIYLGRTTDCAVLASLPSGGHGNVKISRLWNREVQASRSV